jgi:hypothetical protein
MLPPTRPPSPKYSFGNRARACFDPVGFSRMCVRPRTQALGERRAPQHWCTVGAGMWGDMEGTGEHKRDSEFPPGLPRKQSPHGRGMQQTFPPGSMERYRGVARVGRCNVHMLRVDRACPFGHREVGVGGGRRCDHPLYPSRVPKARIVRCAPYHKFHPTSCMACVRGNHVTYSIIRSGMRACGLAQKGHRGVVLRGSSPSGNFHHACGRMRGCRVGNFLSHVHTCDGQQFVV